MMFGAPNISQTGSATTKKPDLRQEWRDAEADLIDALDDWHEAPQDKRGETFAIYRAASDREEAAAAALRDSLRP